MNSIYNFKTTVFKIILSLLLGTGLTTQAGNVTSFEFNGTNEGIYYSGSSAFNVTDNWTFEAWINVDGVSGWDDFMFRNEIFSFQVKDPLGSGDFALDFYKRNSPTAELSTDDTEDLDFNTWYHVAATYDGTTAKLYVNSTVVHNDATTNWTLNTNIKYLSIGDRNASGTHSNFFNGEIDEVRLSNIARTVDEMQTVYSREEYTSDANTLLLVHFDEQVSPPTYVSGTGYTDDVNNYNTGTTNYEFESLAAVNLLRPNYQTQTTGNWGDASTWQYYNGSTTTYENASLTPNFYDNDIAVKSTHTITVGADVEVNQVTVEDGATINVASGKEMTLHLHSSNGMTVSGDVTIDGTLTVDSGSPFIITSDASSQGSVINNGTVTGDANVQCYTTSGGWHGMSAPVNNQTANALYLGGNPDVWMKSYNESDNSYTYVTDLNTDLGDMKGWMVFIETGAAANTYSYSGSMRGDVGIADNVVRTSAGDSYGYNFVGNPYTSAIDWDGAGWTKTNVDNATYVYNNGNWASYIAGAGSNGGSQYIAMNQGFFVQVSDGSATGTLQMTTESCVHNDVSFKKNPRDTKQEIIRLQISDNDLIDETVIRINSDATEGWDGNLDAHKLFSFNNALPQIYSTDNGFMSINSLPEEVATVLLDVVGKDGNQMTISALEVGNYDQMLLYDEYLEEITDLIKDDYTFTYSNNITDRFSLSFLITDIEEESTVSQLDFYTYSSNKKIKVVVENNDFANISIYNLLGQEVASTTASSPESSFNINNSGYYLVTVTNNINTVTKKVFVK